MKRSELKHLIKEVIVEMYQQDTTFAYNVNVNLAAVGKGAGLLEDVGVQVQVAGNYEDNSFDHAFGTHDPGSGFLAEDIKIFADEDVFMYDDAGNPILNQKLFNKGQEIPEAAIDEKSMQQLLSHANKQLTSAGKSAKDDWDVGRYEDSDR